MKNKILENYEKSLKKRQIAKFFLWALCCLITLRFLLDVFLPMGLPAAASIILFFVFLYITFSLFPSKISILESDAKRDNEAAKLIILRLAKEKSDAAKEEEKEKKKMALEIESLKLDLESQKKKDDQPPT
ncbi:MAG: hypothetical protein MI745_02740 [Pseudomonadales bacterium]|nr:hypothetical protein [Pseudomonadales bacterium]